MIPIIMFQARYFHEEDEYRNRPTSKKIAKWHLKLSSRSSHNIEMKSHSPLTSHFLMKFNSLSEKYFVIKIWSALQKFSFWFSADVLSGGLLGNVWESGWRRWWWLRKIDLLSVPSSSKIIFFIPISRCFSTIFFWQMNKWKQNEKT